MTPAVAAPRRGPSVFDADEVRVEGRAKVSGRAAYVADVRRPNALYAAFATSPHAHARILSIDTSAAKNVPGVHAVLTAADIGPGKRSGRRIYDIPVLAYDTVRFIGDRVAAVAAETREAAAEAARLIEVAYDELPAVLDPVAAAAADAPVLHPDYASYRYLGDSPPLRTHPNMQGSVVVTKGDADLAAHFAGAYRVFEHAFSTPRQHAGYIEPHATVVWIDAEGVVHVHTVNKQPFTVRQCLSDVIGLPPEKIVVEVSTIGGDFGGKGLTIDEYPCYYLARATGRPVTYVFSYVEELQASSARHPARITLKTAVDVQGRFIAHASDVVYDGGAYAGGKPGPNLLPGPVGYATVGYQVPHVRLAVSAFYTNTIPSAHVRAPADVQLCFAWEQHVDMIAQALGVDPIELRLRNVMRDGQTAVTGEAVHDPRGYAVLEALKGDLDAHPAPAGRAWGVALACRHTGGGKTAVDATLHPDGTIEVVCGVPDQGCGSYTVAQRIVAETLGVELARVRVRAGNTRDAKRDPGSGGSRVTYVVGSAARVAAEALAAAIARGDAAPIHVVGEFDGTQHDASHPADYSFSAIALDVEVDRETGTFAIHDALVVADVGRIINPVAHQGQLDGGFVSGLGGATMEEMPLDESGKLTALSLADYKLPCMRDVPPLRTILVEAPSLSGPFGAKMAGELSNTGVAPALANAVAAATGARLDAFPITSERIYAALQRL
jgi:CO/xanthine dehydrogenase Mo-binding subunit